jgi:DNA polymerase III subunit delta'
MWTNVIGEERVKHILRNALEHEKLPGAYLFSGPEGTGKDAAAIELAKAINCTGKPGGLSHSPYEACDECESCISISSFASSSVLFIHALPKKSDDDGAELKEEDVAIVREQRVAKAADLYYNIEIPRALTIHIGQIRELRLLLARSVSGAKKRVVIVSEAQMMNDKSQNAFLKTLEEPHANTIIILTSSNANGLLPTVHSRCQDVRFDVLTVDDIKQALVERESLSEDEAVFLARLAAGSYSRARAMIGEDVKEMRKEIVAFLRMGLSKSRRNAVLEINKLLPRSGGNFLEKRQAVEQCLVLLTLWLRDALALSVAKDSEVNQENEIINLDQLEDLRKFVARFGEPRRIITAIASVDRAMHHTKLQLQLRPVMLQLVVDLEMALG